MNEEQKERTKSFVEEEKQTGGSGRGMKFISAEDTDVVLRKVPKLHLPCLAKFNPVRMPCYTSIAIKTMLE